MRNIQILKIKRTAEELFEGNGRLLVLFATEGVPGDVQVHQVGGAPLN